MIRRYAAPRQRRIALVTALCGNVVPIVILGHHHRQNEHQQLWVVLIGVTLGIASPIVVNLLPVRLQWSLRIAAFSGIVGLTLMQANVGWPSGVNSPYAVLLVVPMVWFGLMTTGADLRAGCALVVGCCFLPTLLAPDYYGRPSDALGPAVALAVVAVAVALSLAGLTRETRRLTQELRGAALHDLLSGLLNRRGWEEVSGTAVQALSTSTPVCVVLLDLDDLKKVNDSMGHDEGDALLRGTGQRLRETFGDAAAVARLGGDEFAVLTIGADVATVMTQLAALRGTTPESAGFSAGVAMAEPHESLRETMRRADLALYEAKTTGRGRDLVAGSSVTVDRTGSGLRHRS